MLAQTLNDPSLELPIGKTPGKIDDHYYPPEEVAQRATLSLPVLLAVKEGQALLADSSGRRMEVRVGGSVQDWDLLALAEVGGERVAVLERHFSRWGMLAYVKPSGTLATIRKTIGRLDRITGPGLSYPAGYEKVLIESKSDILGQKVLAGDEDPSFETCAALLPDLTGYTFLSTEESDEILAVDPNGIIGTINDRYGQTQRQVENVVFDPRKHLPPHNPGMAKLGLVGGYLPCIDYGYYDINTGLGWEEIAFAKTLSHRDKPVLYVYLRTVRGHNTVERKYFRYENEAEHLISAAEFFSELLELKLHWDTIFAEGMGVQLPEQRITDAAYASIARAFITYNGSAPHYGVGFYGKKEHDAFPPTTLSMVNTCLEFGLLSRARLYLDYYLDHVLKDDGTFNYYGSAISEYGQLFETISRYVRLSGESKWLQARLPKIESMIQWLLDLRRESQTEFGKENLYYGLISGSPEADTRAEVNYYFSGNFWAWRGWLEIARLFTESEEEALRRRGVELLAECQAYQTDIEASIEKSVLRDIDPSFVPPVPDFDKPFDTMTQNRFASYTNYRYWIEMLSAGFLRPEWRDAIIDYRTKHGGELLGTTRFNGHLDDWTYAGYAYALLQDDRVRHYLLGFYGDLAVHRMRGTFTAYEQTAILSSKHERSYIAGYCVPAQLVTPLMTKWMLVFEERDADILWLCRATPRRWLAAGGKGVVVKRATTRWGSINYSVRSIDETSLVAKIELSDEMFPGEIRLRLRTPSAKTIKRVTVNGIPHADFDNDEEYIRFSQPKEKILEVLVSY